MHVLHWMEKLSQFNGDKERVSRLLHIPEITNQWNTKKDYSITEAIEVLNDEEFVLLLAVNYEQFCSNLTHSSDKVVKKIANYMALCDDYNIYIENIWQGDSIHSTWIYFIWVATYLEASWKNQLRYLNYKQQQWVIPKDVSVRVRDFLEKSMYKAIKE